MLSKTECAFKKGERAREREIERQWAEESQRTMPCHTVLCTCGASKATWLKSVCYGWLDVCVFVCYKEENSSARSSAHSVYKKRESSNSNNPKRKIIYTTQREHIAFECKCSLTHVHTERERDAQTQAHTERGKARKEKKWWWWWWCWLEREWVSESMSIEHIEKR